MSTPTHILVGVGIAYWTSLAYPQETWSFILPVSILTANLPDIDTLLYGISHRHRTESPLHYPIVWILGMILAVVCLWLLGSPVPWERVWIISMGVGSHLILDTIGVNGGLAWLGPLHRHEYSLFPMVKRRKTPLENAIIYIHHPSFIIEIGIWVGAIIYAMRYVYPTL